MKLITKLALAFVAGAIVVVVGFVLVGNQSGEVFGATVGVTRYPNSGIVARCLNITTSAGTATACTDGSATFTGATSITGASTVTGSFTIDAIGSGVLIASGTTATNSTTSLTAANICDNNIIQWTPTVANASATLPDGVPLQADCLDTQGSYRDILFENTGGVGSTTLFAVGASTTIEYVSSTGANGAISGGDGTLLRFYNSTTTTGASSMVKIKVIPFND